MGMVMVLMIQGTTTNIILEVVVVAQGMILDTHTAMAFSLEILPLVIQIYHYKRVMLVYHRAHHTKVVVKHICPLFMYWHLL